MPNQEKKSNRLLITAIILALILVTRGLSLEYQLAIHPDEYKFARATDSLMHSMLEPGREFTEVKEYPEGAYLFHLPFHFLGKLMENTFGIEYNMGLCGRVSSVFYFCLAVLIGMKILREYLHGSVVAELFFGLGMCFSLFFIEHSRYGTGDMISLFLLLAIIWLTAKAADDGFKGARPILIYALCGALAAVKYPLLQFILIPLGAYWYCSEDRLLLKGLKTVLGIAAAFAGLLLFSPKAIGDIGYFARVIQNEMSSYVMDGTTFEAGGLLNHIAEISLFLLLYSDIPLGCLATAGIFRVYARRDLKSLKAGERIAPESFIFQLLVPVICVIFFLYNLFPKLLIFRTYTPFIGLSLLYSSLALSKFWQSSSCNRALLSLAMAFMILRGGCLLYVMSSEDKVQESMMAQIEAAVDESWNNTVILRGYDMPLEEDRLINPKKYNLDMWLELHGGDPSLAPGTLCITGAYEYALAGDYILPVLAKAPVNQASAEENYKWDFFKEINGTHYVGQSYPDYYYYLFGGWIRGGTLGTTVIPCNQIYYFGAK